MTLLAFGFGNPVEWAIIAAVALIVFGPHKMPELGRQLGQLMRDFRKVADDITGAAHSVRDEVEMAYKPTLTQSTSSATVEQAMTHPPYDQEPQTSLPAEPAKSTGGLTLSTLPPSPLADDTEVKGH